MSNKFNNDLFYLCHPAGQLKELNRLADLGELEEKQKNLQNLQKVEGDTMEEFLKRKIIHMLNIAIRASFTDKDEKIFFKAIIKDISALDPNAVNIPVTVIKYLGYVKESPAITILKTDVRNLYIYMHFLKVQQELNHKN